jgi:hypothetical protein
MKPCHGGSKCPMEQFPVPPIDVLTKHAARHHLEDTMKKNKGAKVKKSAARQEQVRKAAVDAFRDYATARTLRLARLERAVKALPGDPGLDYMLSRELLKQGREDDERAKRGLPPLDQASAIRTATAPAIGRALGAAINRGPLDQRGSLVSVANGTYTRHSPAELPGGDPTLPSLRENHRTDTNVEIAGLEKQLRKAATPEERQILGFKLTRARLIEGHRSGALAPRPMGS